MSLSMILGWVFLPNADYSFVHFFGELATTEGIVLESKTAKGKGPLGTGQLLYGFRTKDGKIYEGLCFSLFPVHKGSKIKVEYRKDDPKISRLKDIRGDSRLLFLIFLVPLVGLLSLIFGFLSGLRMIACLKRGVLAPATLKSSEPTNMAMNNRTIFRETYEYQDTSGRTFEIQSSTTNPALAIPDMTGQIGQMTDLLKQMNINISLPDSVKEELTRRNIDPEKIGMVDQIAKQFNINIETPQIESKHYVIYHPLKPQTAILWKKLKEYNTVIDRNGNISSSGGSWFWPALVIFIFLPHIIYGYIDSARARRLIGLSYKEDLRKSENEKEKGMRIREFKAREYKR